MVGQSLWKMLCPLTHTRKSINQSIFIFSCPSSSRPTLVTHLLTNCFVIVLDSKPSSLPDQTPTSQNWCDGGLEKIWPNQKKDNDKENIRTKAKTMKMTNTFWEHLQRAISETFDLWDISSEWWENMTWPTKRQWQNKDKDNNNDKYI